MSIERNKELVRRYVEDLHSQGDLDAVDEIIGDRFTVRTQHGCHEIGREDLKRSVVQRRTLIPDFQAIVDEMVAEGDKVVVRGRDEGTPASTYMGIPPSGKRFSVSWIDIYRIEDGRIVDMWAEMSMETLRKQLAG